MPNIEQNKDLALRFMQAFSDCDFDLWGSFMAADATYEIMGHSGMSKLYTKDEVIAASRSLLNVFPGGVPVAVTGLTAEGNRVALEGRGSATTADGRQYNNAYHILYEIEDGKIRRAREYLCTKLVDQVLFSS